MKLAANLSLMFTELPLLERFAAARNAGFEAVEIQFPYEESITDLAMACADADLKLVLMNVPAGDLMSGGEGLASVPERQCEFRDAVAKCRDYAEALGVRCINVLSGRCQETQQQDRRWHNFVENLQLADAHFAPLGITTTFEAINTTDMPRFLIHSAQQMWDVMAEVDSPTIKAQYDLYHMAMMGEDLEADLRQHVDSIGHIQFADCPGRGEPGTGTLDWSVLFSLIDVSGYAGYVAAEYRPTESTENSFGWLRDLMLQRLYR